MTGVIYSDREFAERIFMRQSVFLLKVDKMQKTEYNNGCYHILLHNGIYEMNKIHSHIKIGLRPSLRVE